MGVIEIIVCSKTTPSPRNWHQKRQIALFMHDKTFIFWYKCSNSLKIPLKKLENRRLSGNQEFNPRKRLASKITRSKSVRFLYLGLLKSQVYSPWPNNLDDRETNIRGVVGNLKPGMIRSAIASMLERRSFWVLICKI